MDDRDGGRSRIRRRPDVLWRNVGAAVLTARPGREGFDLLSGGAGHVWRCLDEPRTPDEILAGLTAAGVRPPEPEVAVRDVLDDLRERGLVESAGPEQGRS